MISAADRWRGRDPDPSYACRAAADVLHILGYDALAWEYLITPLDGRSLESNSWIVLARTLRQQGLPILADKAYAAAFEADPTKAEMLWERALNLGPSGQRDAARHLLRQLADGQWPSRFDRIKALARQQLERRGSFDTIPNR